jgi:trk system potassium uptake protein TrkH
VPTLASESLGAIALAGLFLRAGDSVGQALWRGVFTSISAFCNAGFALQTDSLIPYQSDPLVLHTVGVLIILGGISPMAIFALVPLARRSVVPVLAQAKLALVAAGVLLVGGFVSILAFEWNASLSGLSVLDKLHNAWFQSVSLRTAGFNSVDLTLMHPATLVIAIVWMFIGGSPGGTAGGVKTTTIAILFLSVIQSIRGRTGLEVFGKRIPGKTRARAAAVVAIAACTGTLALVAIFLTQAMPDRVAVFEVFSALGTVGLSIGGTGLLDGVGKLIIIFCMFVGRVGGLSLLMFLSARKFVPRVGRPVEEVDVG